MTSLVERPRQFDLTNPQEIRRLLLECGGYLRTCKRHHHGTDFEGRDFAMQALRELAERLPHASITPPRRIEMALTMSREEKSAEIAALVHAIREAAIAPARDGGLNLAEVINAFAQAFASILVGAYGNKNREVVLTTFPDLVRAYFPQWEAIYASITPPESDNG